ncbi:hypothetical protein MKY15_11730 [Sporosarcina sp. FSL K6-1540]|uniref:hypothetical protein n=1 Tax=Sporosarcina TaxID=1569 RepID=UPI00078DC6EA|nr:hypothetical protein [Sporosarcina psychrophila]AMQ05233.1 hypothetical protein AZE41_04375 [Sporosarcina psychrophila]
MEERILLVLFTFIILIILANKFFGTHFIKMVLHITLYLFEIILVTYLMNITFLELDLFNPPSNYFEALRNYMFFFSIYQLVLIVTFKLLDSTEVDALNTIKKHIDQSQVFAEFNKEIPDNHKESLLYLIKSKKVTLNNKYRNFSRRILDLIDGYNKGDLPKDEFRCILKLESLELDLHVKTLGYGWSNSVLLRISK